LNLNSIKEPTDEQLQAILDACKEYVEAYKTKPTKPMKPFEPSRYEFSDDYKTHRTLSDDEYNAKMEDFNKRMGEYEEKLNAYNNSEEKLAWEERERALRKLMRHGN
jgi:hypothetical protein